MQIVLVSRGASCRCEFALHHHPPSNDLSSRQQKSLTKNFNFLDETIFAARKDEKFLTNLHCESFCSSSTGQLAGVSGNEPNFIVR
jgi:hypothetical protein